MIKAYIAGSYSGRARVKAEADRLKKYGVRILSHWFNDDHFIEKAWDGDLGGKVAESMAMGDLYQILDADLFILDTMDKSSTGGSDTELGLALIRNLDRNINLVHIGPYRNIFQTLVREHYETWEDFFKHLEGGKIII